MTLFCAYRECSNFYAIGASKLRKKH